MSLLASSILSLMAAPTSANEVDWRWERDTPVCSLTQSLGTDAQIVQLSRTGGSDESVIYVGGAERLLENSKSLDGAKVSFHPGGEAVAEVSVTQAGPRRDLFVRSRDAAFVSKLASASVVEVHHEELGSVRIPLRSAAAAVAAMRACEDAKMREWGIDPLAWRALRSRPLPVKDWSAWISSDDYPISALLKGSQGYMILRLRIAADGRVEDCQRLISGHVVQTRIRLCSKLKLRARFEPAVAASGQKVAAPYMLVIRFRLAD